MNDISPGTMQKAIGERLRRTREARGFKKVRDFAEVLDMNPNSYGRYEQGIRDIDKPTLYRICMHLQVSSDWLLFGFTSGLTAEAIQHLRKHKLIA